MAKRHLFDQMDILGLNRHKRTQDDNWRRFENTYKELGYTIRTTGGVVLTHEINCDLEDFQVVLELANI